MTSSCKQESEPPSAADPLGKLGSAVPAVEELSCLRSFVFAELAWHPAAAYDEIRVYRGDHLVGILPGTIDRFTDCLLQADQPICGFYEYEVLGVLDDEVSDSAFVCLAVGSISWEPNSDQDIAGYRLSFSIAPVDVVLDCSPNPFHVVLDLVTTCKLSLRDLFGRQEFRENVERIYGISGRTDLAGDTFERKLEAFLESGQIYLRVQAVDTKGNVSSPSDCRPFRYRIQASNFPACT